MEYLEVDGKLFPVIKRVLQQIGDESVADTGVETFIVSDYSDIYEISRRYENGFDTTVYGEVVVTKLCSLNEIKTLNSLL